ncbi:MAG: transposase [Myxococcales bacterium]|nr:transposase [Myxococcales bacterium]
MMDSHRSTSWCSNPRHVSIETFFLASLMDDNVGTFAQSNTLRPGGNVDSSRSMERGLCCRAARIQRGRWRGPGLVVMAADVFRRLPLDWSLTGKGIGERTSMQKLVHRLPFKAGDVAVMDRGFPSRHLFSALIEHGVDIIARMSASKATAWKELKPFLSSNKKTAKVTLTLPGAKGNIELQVRVVERDAKPGRPRKGTKNERMVIVSTLSGKDGFDRKDIIKLYASRWGIESLFKEMKSFMQTEDFHSKSVQGCEQELISAMIWIALASFLQAEAERTLDGRRVVRTDCLRAAGNLLFAMLSGKSIIEQMDDDIAALRMFAYAPQQDRHYPRECKRPFGRTIQRGGA